MVLDDRCPQIQSNTDVATISSMTIRAWTLVVVVSYWSMVLRYYIDNVEKFSPLSCFSHSTDWGSFSLIDDK